MKIKSINTGLLLSPLKTPFITAVRSVDVLTDVIVRIETDTGLVGWGAAAPTAKVTGETVGSITGAVNEVIAPQLLESDCGYLEGNLDLLDGALLHNTSAKAAVDIALHDIWGKSVGQPVWKLFGGNGKSIVSDVTISLNSPEVMAADTVAAVERGFSIVKIKVGGEVSLDFERLKTIFNAVGSNVKVRLDANQGWKPNEAVKILCEMETSGFAIELVEQPVKSFDMDGLRFVTAHSPFPVMADEKLPKCQRCHRYNKNTRCRYDKYKADEMWWDQRRSADNIGCSGFWCQGYGWRYVGGQGVCCGSGAYRIVL